MKILGGPAVSRVRHARVPGDFVSPKGGKVPFSMDVDQTDPPGMISYTLKYEGFREKSNATLTPDQVDPAKYTAVFIGGGAGPLFDVASDPKLLSLIAKVYENGGVLGGCGHGPGSFSNVKLSTGEYLVKGKRVTGFPNSSEKTKKWSKEARSCRFWSRTDCAPGVPSIWTRMICRTSMMW